MQAFLRGGLILTTILIILISIPVTANADTASRIELNDGTVYQDVTFRVDRQFKVIYVTDNGDKTTHSFTDIRQILDEDGEDVTERITGLKPAPKVSITPKPISPAPTEQPTQAVQPAQPAQPAQPSNQQWMSTEQQARKYSGRPFGASLSVHGSIGIPLGTWFEGFTTGPGFGFDVAIPVAKRIALRGSISKAGIKVSDSYLAGYGVASFDVSTWRYLFGAQYFNWPRWREGGRTVYNLWSQIGATSQSAFGGLASTTKFTTNTGLSAITLVSETVGLEFCGNADVLWIGTVNDGNYYGTYGNVQTAVILDFRVGLVMMIR